MQVQRTTVGVGHGKKKEESSFCGGGKGGQMNSFFFTMRDNVVATGMERGRLRKVNFISDSK